MQNRQSDKGRRKRRIIIACAVVLAVWAIVGGVKRLKGGADSEATYGFGKVTRGTVRSYVSATGTVQPWKVVDVKSDVAGRMVKLAVDLGDQVKAGQLIALIDPTDTRTAYTQAEADLASARAKAAQAAVEAQVQPALTAESISEAQHGLDATVKSVLQARQNKQQLQQQLAQLREVTVPQNVEDSRSNLQQAKANVETADAEYKRQKELLAKGYSSKSEVESAYAHLATLESSLKTAEQRQRTVERQNDLSVKQLESQIAQAETTIQANQARVRQQKASLALARKNAYQNQVKAQDYQASAAAVARSRASLQQAATNMSYARIVAPRAGVVLSKNVEEGTVVPSSRGSIGSTNALLQLGDLSRMWIVCQVDETDIAQVRVGQKVSVRVDAYPERAVPGKVIRIDPQAKLDQNVTTIPVTVELNHPDFRFKPGMNAECDFLVAEAHDVLLAPNEAVKGAPGGYFVLTLADGKPKKNPVKVGLAGNEDTEILSGVTEGMQVITRITEPEGDSGPNNPLAFGPPGRRSGQGSSRTGGAGGGGSRAGGGGGGR